MKVSVVVCTYDEQLYDHLREAVESIQRQTYDDIEIIVVVDGNETLFERIQREYGDAPEIRIHCNDENVGLSASRNRGFEHATGDIVAFMDDDAVASRRWIEQLVSVYERRDAIAVGGKMTPIWLAGKPQFLPAEFYWLVGVTHRGFADDGEEVRNTFGSNISFRTDVFEALGGFETDIGRRGDKNLQAEEPELCARMQTEYGQGVIYTAEATVGHKVFAYRTRKRWLCERAFWQGYSKRAMEDIVSADASSAESSFLTQLLFEFLPARGKSLISDPKIAKAQQLVMLILLTGLVGLGYLYGVLKRR